MAILQGKRRDGNEAKDWGRKATLAGRKTASRERIKVRVGPPNEVDNKLFQ